MPRISIFTNETELVNYALSSIGQRSISSLELNGERVHDLIVKSLPLVKSHIFGKFNRPYSFANKACQCALVKDLGDDGSIWSVAYKYYCITNVRYNPVHFGKRNTHIKWHNNEEGYIVTDFRISSAPSGAPAGELLLADANVDVDISLWPVSAIKAYITILQKYLTYALSGQSEDVRLVWNEIDLAMADVELNDKTASSSKLKLFYV